MKTLRPNQQRAKDRLKKIYRSSLNCTRYEAIVWNDLKKLYVATDWKHEIFEEERCIKSSFATDDNKIIKFYLFVNGGYLQLISIIDENFDEDFTPELFTLATHFNNLLEVGIVRINVESKFVEFEQKIDILQPLLYSEKNHNQLIKHYDFSKGIHLAFQKLIEKDEEPMLIIKNWQYQKLNIMSKEETLLFEDYLKRMNEKTEQDIGMLSAGADL